MMPRFCKSSTCAGYLAYLFQNQEVYRHAGNLKATHLVRRLQRKSTGRAIMSALSLERICSVANTLVVLMAHALHPDHLPTRQAAWYPKAEPTFVDALAADIYGSNEIRQLGLLSWVPSIHRSLSLTCSLRLLATLLKLAKVESRTRLWPILPRLTSHHS